MAGIKAAKTMKAVHAAASGAESHNQPAVNASVVRMGVSERRRLSVIFQRPSGGKPPAPVRPAGAPPTIHGNNCQSPLTQRCWRAAAAA